MIETFYVHLQFLTKNGLWSINLPFLCSRCAVCCTLDDFLTAGPVKLKLKENPEIETKLHTLYEYLESLLEEGQEKYDNHTMHTPCPFKVENACTIYAIRPDGCRQFPNTRFGMQTTDCEALTRFKKQRATLKRGKVAKETYHFTDTKMKPAKYKEKQLQTCITKLRQAGITSEELALFKTVNENEKS